MRSGRGRRGLFLGLLGATLYGLIGRLARPIGRTLRATWVALREALVTTLERTKKTGRFAGFGGRNEAGSNRARHGKNADPAQSGGLAQGRKSRFPHGNFPKNSKVRNISGESEHNVIR